MHTHGSVTPAKVHAHMRYMCSKFYYIVADEDASRREAVRKKTGGYLRHAEKIYNQHLANKVRVNFIIQ